MKIIKIRIKTLETAALLRSNMMSIKDFKIFKMVDKVYHKFVGAYKNVPVSLILYKGGYDFNTMQKLFDFIKLLKIKNSKARQASMKFKVEAAIANLCSRGRSEVSHLRKAYTLENQISDFLKDTHINENTIIRYRKQINFRHDLVTHPV